MANETNNARQSTAPSVPERVLRIDGERTAAMYSLAIRVSRLDQRLRDLAGVSTVEGRKQYRQATEGFQKHIAQFEDGLAEVEKDADVNSRRGGRTNSSPQQRRGAPQRQQQSGAAANSGKPAPAPQQSAKPAEIKPVAMAPAPQTAPAAPAAQAAPAAPAAPKPEQPIKPQKQPQKPAQQSQQPKSEKANGQANPSGKKQNNGGNGKGPKQSGATPQQQKAQQPQAVATVTL